MAIIDDLNRVYQMVRGLALGMKSNQVADGSAWNENNNQTNAIQFESEKRNVSYALNYFKKIYPSKWKDNKGMRPLGYNVAFMVFVGPLG